MIGGDASATATGLSPDGVAVDRNGNIYAAADATNHVVSRIDAATGVITTVAGNGTQGFAGDGGAATSAELYNPSGLAVDGLGDLFIADTYNDCIRRVDAATGVITTVAGGAHGFAGDGGTATSAAVAYPSGVAVDGLGDLFIADTGNNRVRRVDAQSGVITTVAGTGAFGFAGDGGAATSAELNHPSVLAVDGLGDVFIADTYNCCIRRIDAQTGVITTVAGNGAELTYPRGVVVDEARRRVHRRYDQRPASAGSTRRPA